ncbi:MAG: hypothetical protein GY778_20995 [bacterium]|nr:hypothetical protein [bacterium]
MGESAPTAVPDVLASCRRVVDRADHVRLDSTAALAWAKGVSPQALDPPPPPAELCFEGDRDQCANFALLSDCLNFCFWSTEPWSVSYRGRPWRRTYAMMAGLLRAIDEDPAWLTPTKWTDADVGTVTHLFRGTGTIPLPEDRCRVLNETGRQLVQHFDGRFSLAVQKVGGDARELAYLLADRFPSFRDVATYRGQTVTLLKRAQICASDLHHLLTRNGHGGLSRLGRLTVFADYRLPQYLRHIGVMTVTPVLAEAIQRQQEIPAGSAAEVELRAATVVAGELLREALTRAKHRIEAWRLDYVLWERSHDPAISIDHHRTRTIYY